MTSKFFQRLPVELQLKIFEETLQPRALRLFDSKSDEKVWEKYADGAPPVVLQLCQMLREYFLPRYPKLLQDEECSSLWPPQLRFNPDLDIIVLYFDTPKALMTLSVWVVTHPSPAIRHLAISASLWQAFVLTAQYPDWKKSMAKFGSLQILSVVSDQMMPNNPADREDVFKQAIEQTLISTHRENENWTIPEVVLIRTGEVCRSSIEAVSRLDFVDFAKGDVKEDYLKWFTTPACSAFDDHWITKRFANGFPKIRNILQWNKRTRRRYVPTPSMFGLWPHTVAAQLPQEPRFVFDASFLACPLIMMTLSFTSFAIISSFQTLVIWRAN